MCYVCVVVSHGEEGFDHVVVPLEQVDGSYVVCEHLAYLLSCEVVVVGEVWW